jgi:hypothetical protein
MSPKGSQERQRAVQMLLTQTRWPTITMKQSVEAMLALSQVCPLRSKEREKGIEVLSALAHRPDLSVEDAWAFITLDFDFAPLSIIETTPALKRQQLAERKDILLALVAFERTDTHLLSVSVRSGSFKPLRGIGTGPSTHLSLGPTPGLNLALGDEPRAVDPDAVYALLAGPSEDRVTSLRVSRKDLWSGINLWLALHAPRICHLAAVGPLAEHNLVPDLFGGSSQFHATLGLFEERTLCVLMRSSDPAACQESSPEMLSGPLLIRRFGPDEQLAERLREYLVAWEITGRPSSATCRIRVYPQEALYVPQASEMVVAKRWSKLILDWP